MAAQQAPPSLGFSRQEHWSGLPFPSPMHESEKWKWSRSVVSDPSLPHGLQLTRLLRSWDFPVKSTGVGCHCLLPRVESTVYLGRYSIGMGFPGGTSEKEPACQCRRHKRHRFDPWVRKIPWRRKWKPTPVFLPGESHGPRSGVGCSPWGCKDLDMTESDLVLQHI